MLMLYGKRMCTLHRRQVDALTRTRVIVVYKWYRHARVMYYAQSTDDMKTLY